MNQDVNMILPDGVPSNLPFPVGKPNDAFAQEISGEDAETEWCEPVDDEQYKRLHLV